VKDRTTAVFAMLLWLTFVINVGVSLIVPAMPVLMRQYGFSYGSLSAVFLAIVASRCIFMNVGGKVVSRIGHTNLLLLCFGLHVVTMAAYPFVTTPSAFIAFRFLEGAFEGMASLVLNDLAIALTTKENRSKRMGYFGAAFGLGFIFGPALGSLTLTQFGTRGMFWSAAVMSAIGVLGLALAYGRCSAIPRPAPKGSFFANMKAEYFSYFALFSPNLLRRVLLFSLQIVLPLHLLDMFRVPSTRAGYVFSVSGIVSTALQPFAGRIFAGKTQARQARRLVAASLVTMAVALTAMGFVSGMTAFMALFVVETVAFSVMLPAATRVFGDAVEAEPHRAQILGFFSSARELAALLVPITLVPLYRASPAFAWAAMGCVSLVSSFPFFAHAPTPERVDLRVEGG
jgi:MFS family permease